MISGSRLPTLLITGANGFIGSAIIARLIQGKGWDRCIFLVRAPSREDGLAKLAHSLRKHAVAEEALNRLRLGQILCGDLTYVPDWKNDPRLSSIIDVVNCAAVASFSNHPSIWPTNVDGVVSLAKVLHERCRLRRFLHLGTAMSCGRQAPKLVLEGYDAGSSTEHFLQYTESKYEAERRLRTQLRRLPLVVARPSIVVGHTLLGCIPSGSIYWVFRLARALRSFPCELSQKIDVIPVDYCAKVVQHLIEKRRLRHTVYHISAGPKRCSSFAEIDFAIAKGIGEKPLQNYQTLPPEKIASRYPDFERRIGSANRRLVLRAIKAYGNFAKLGMIFDNSRTLAEGIELPTRFTEYAGACEITSSNTLISEQMKFDYK